MCLFLTDNHCFSSSNREYNQYHTRQKSSDESDSFGMTVDESLKDIKVSIKEHSKEEFPHFTYSHRHFHLLLRQWITTFLISIFLYASPWRKKYNKQEIEVSKPSDVGFFYPKVEVEVSKSFDTKNVGVKFEVSKDLDTKYDDSEVIISKDMDTKTDVAKVVVSKYLDTKNSDEEIEESNSTDIESEKKNTFKTL